MNQFHLHVPASFPFNSPVSMKTLNPTPYLSLLHSNLYIYITGCKDCYKVGIISPKPAPNPNPSNQAKDFHKRKQAWYRGLSFALLPSLV